MDLGQKDLVVLVIAASTGIIASEVAFTASQPAAHVMVMALEVDGGLVRSRW